jgi:acetyltransferase-like isoleucine patch superfamily enzyme
VQFWNWPRIHHPEHLSIGRRVAINDDFWANAKGTIAIGNDVLIGPSVIIHSANHNWDRSDVPIRRQGHTGKKVTIEDDVWLGARVTVLPGVTVGKGAVVGAGAVVTRDVPPYAVVGGVPAKPIRFRGTGSFFGPFGAEKCACPLPPEGDGPPRSQVVSRE